MARITRLLPDELERLLLLQPMIFADYRHSRKPFDLAYIFGETTDNEDSGFEKAISLVRAKMTTALGMCSGSTDAGYPGYEHSVRRLREKGLSRRVLIIPIRVKGRPNTRSEADALVRVTDITKAVAIIAPPFHIFRAFVSTVTAMFESGRLIRVYAVPGSALPWSTRVRHSQGTLDNTREGLLGNELERLERYRDQHYGSLADAVKISEYFAWRNSVDA